MVGGRKGRGKYSNFKNKKVSIGIVLNKKKTSFKHVENNSNLVLIGSYFSLI